MSDNFGFLPQATIRYKTYVKTAMVEGLREVFANHKDPKLSETKVTIDYPRREADYPTVIVRFFEREIKNAGIAHEEYIRFNDENGNSVGSYRFKHYFYTGDIEFGVYALSSLDRDLIGDTLVQVLAMGNLESYTNRFLARIYADTEKYPDSIWHYITVNTDTIQGFGESQNQTPWASEDDLIYQTSYRARIWGEFYSVPPNLPAPIIERVTQYPYIKDAEAVPEGDPNDYTEWQPPI